MEGLRLSEFWMAGTGIFEPKVPLETTGFKSDFAFRKGNGKKRVDLWE